MGFIIKVTNERLQMTPFFIGTIQISETDFKKTVFASLEEASEHPFPLAEAAAMAVSTLPKTANQEFEILEVVAVHR